MEQKYLKNVKSFDFFNARICSFTLEYYQSLTPACLRCNVSKRHVVTITLEHGMTLTFPDMDSELRVKVVDGNGYTLKNQVFEMNREKIVKLGTYTKVGSYNIDCFYKNVQNKNIKSNLNKNLNDSLISALFSDVSIMSCDGKEFGAHKVILASRSDVLKAHLMHDTTECRTNQIQSKFDAEVIKELLGFMYTEEIQNLDELCEKLLAAADFYKVEDLKSICEFNLCTRLTENNAIETLKLADLYSAQNLKQFSARFTFVRLKNIQITDAWAALDSPELIKYILASN